MIPRIYVKLHIKCCILNIEALNIVILEMEIFFYVFSIISLCKIMTPPGRGLYGPQGLDKKDRDKLLQTKYESFGTYGFFPIARIWELSVAMETTIVIQSARKPETINPPTH